MRRAPLRNTENAPSDRAEFVVLHALPRLSLLLLGAATLTIATGCMRSYEPVSSVHRALVVDTEAPNFTDTHLNVHCVPRDLLINGRSNQLCRAVAQLFENQGAEVETISRWRPPATETADGVAAEPEEEEEEATTPPRAVQLNVEIRARQLSKRAHPLSWLACLASFTVVPGIVETTFEQRVKVWDGENFPLLEDRSEGRILVRAGMGAWLSTRLLDQIWRKKQDRLVGMSVTKDLSKDLYTQLTQAVYRAKLLARTVEPPPTSRVLGSTPAAPTN